MHHEIYAVNLLNNECFWNSLKALYAKPETLLLALHPRIGAQSAVYRLSQHILFERNVVRAIFQTIG